MSLHERLGLFCHTLDTCKGRSKQLSGCTGSWPRSEESMEGIKMENKPGTLMREAQPFSFFFSLFFPGSHKSKLNESLC